MWLVFSYLLTVVLTTVGANNVKFDNFPPAASSVPIGITDYIFGQKLLRAFQNGRDFNTYFRSPENRRLQDILAVKDENLTILKDLKLVNEPEIRITFLDATLKYFSTSIGVDIGELVFTGEILINGVEKTGEDVPTTVEGVRYTLKNVRGFGLVGFGIKNDENFVSTNYFVQYNEGDAKFEIIIGDQTSEDFAVRLPDYSEKRMKSEVRKLTTSILKRRLDAALDKISMLEVFGSSKSSVLTERSQLDDFQNNVLDGIIEDMNKQVDNNNLNEIQIPDIDMPFIYTLAGASIVIQGRIIANNGSLGNLATFVRLGDVSLNFNSGNLIIFGKLGLTELRVDWKDVALELGGVGPHGSLSGRISNNAVELALAINVMNQSMTLVSFDITDLSGAQDAKVAGLGPFNWLAERIAVWAINERTEEIKMVAEPIIENEIREAMGKVHVRQVIYDLIFGRG
ncbi:uncharacterized protein LOC105683561 [Athalia rosae]|uniref:uncharacterized protein LOC105683561 n=1 Tax=Athalia rosae TaxID=37344 RepID=UPI0020333912|nr:uncharacterized protein LOC105683561 [Athalia rosae]